MTPAEAIVQTLLAEITNVLGDRLVGLYIYGSLAQGDFDPQASDIDLVAVTTTPLSWLYLRRLQTMHAALDAVHPEWPELIDIQYLPLEALQQPTRPTGLIAMQRPGTNFHSATRVDRLLVAYHVRDAGRAVTGPAPTTIVAPITPAQVQFHSGAELVTWPEYMQTTHDLAFQTFLILTICHKLYTAHHGRLTSKPQAAVWAADLYPRKAPIIHAALEWRQGHTEGVDPESTYPGTVAFINFMIDEIRAVPTLPTSPQKRYNQQV
ncbi:MAG TPA: aminoglycoside adenylyltransferase domain-containing protein [Candidatus Saccharimonadia bacterium]|nr:aminoglycoside adenylyltransferase domain-containing protein [Candidatus Saccharimonadia bacterium]